MNFEKLISIARAALNPRELSSTSYAGSVACALLSVNNKIYTGVCIDTPSSMGFCAEHAAIAAMITDGESQIKKIVAVYKDGRVIPPCGRCREFIKQIHDNNDQTEVMVEDEAVVMLSELLPFSNFQR